MSTPLDTGQYTVKEIKKYEAVYGRNFISPGGLATAQEFTALLDLQPGMQVLDVGCGIGGGAFYMAEHYGVQVHGLDLSANMLEIARERCREAGLTEQVTFTHGDILTFAGQAGYDRIYSRDVFLHIHDKARLFQQLQACLKPGGRLLFTDYCCGEGEKSAEFAAYIQQRHYDLGTVAEHRHWLEQAGLAVMTAGLTRVARCEVSGISRLAKFTAPHPPIAKIGTVEQQVKTPLRWSDAESAVAAEVSRQRRMLVASEVAASPGVETVPTVEFDMPSVVIVAPDDGSQFAGRARSAPHHPAVRRRCPATAGNSAARTVNARSWRTGHRDRAMRWR